jgi:hypothetical protein
MGRRRYVYFDVLGRVRGSVAQRGRIRQEVDVWSAVRDNGEWTYDMGDHEGSRGGEADKGRKRRKRPRNRSGISEGASATRGVLAF